jgi:hypothetical protein
MSPERAIGRYRRWYARLLRLYPRPFHQRFAEPMAQTFTDLIRERRDVNRGFHAFAIGTFAETSAGIMRENMTQIFQSKVVKWMLITAAVLSVPALAMAFQLAVPDPGSGTDGVSWGAGDFLAAAVMILGAGLLYEWAATRAGTTTHRIAVGLMAGAALLLVWINLAVGIIGEPGNPANLLYFGVLAVLVVGASIARLEPRSMSLVLFATAGAQALVPVIALVMGLTPTWPLDAVFIGLWVASGLLFRQAGVASVPAS